MDTDVAMKIRRKKLGYSLLYCTASKRWPKPNICNQCKFSYSQESHFRKHIKKHSGGDISQKANKVEEKNGVFIVLNSTKCIASKCWPRPNNCRCQLSQCHICHHGRMMQLVQIQIQIQIQISKYHICHDKTWEWCNLYTCATHKLLEITVFLSAIWRH